MCEHKTRMFIMMIVRGGGNSSLFPNNYFLLSSMKKIIEPHRIPTPKHQPQNHAITSPQPHANNRKIYPSAAGAPIPARSAQSELRGADA